MEHSMAANKKAPQDSAGKEPAVTAPDSRSHDARNKMAPVEESSAPAYVGVGGGAPGGGPPGEGLHQREASPNRPR
jgi:hypothetical protein